MKAADLEKNGLLQFPVIGGTVVVNIATASSRAS